MKLLYLVERSETPFCIPAQQEYSLDRIFRQLLMPSDMQQMDHLLAMVDRLVESVPVYRLGCNMTADSVATAYNAGK